jgi:hypothetical protein
VDPGANSGDVDDEAALVRYALALADGIERALPVWVLRAVTARADDWRPGLGDRLRPAAEQAGGWAVAKQGAQVRALLLRDVEAQGASPLAIVRTAVEHPTAVLAAAGVPPLVRDEFSRRAFPDDHYDLAPASFADLDPSLHEAGMVWGAAKAHVILRRRGHRDPPP